MNNRALVVFGVLVLVMLIDSCGFKGPLYLPTKPVASKQVTSSPKSMVPESGAVFIPNNNESYMLIKESNVKQGSFS